MKVVYRLFIVIAAVLLSACSKKNPVEPQQDYHRWFPLQVNNKWYFYHPESPNAKVIYRVWETRELEGKTYYAYGNKAETSELFRQDQIGNVYKKRPNGEVLWFDFRVPDGGTYEVKLSDNFIYTVTVAKNQTVSYDTHSYSDCIIFSFDAAKLTTEEMTYVLAPDIGIVKMQTAWMTLYLDSFEF